MIPVAVVKINKMAESGFPNLGVNEVGFLPISFNNNCLIKDQMTKKYTDLSCCLGRTSPFHLFTNPSVIRRFIFGQGVVIYYVEIRWYNKEAIAISSSMEKSPKECHTALLFLLFFSIYFHMPSQTF